MFVTQLPKTTGNDEIDCKERDASGLQTQRQSSINVGVSSMSMLTLLLLLTLLPRAYSFLDGDTDTTKYRVEEGTNSSAGMQRGRKLIDLSHGKNGEASLRVPERTCRPSKGNLPNLVVIQEWRSAKRRPRESITLMTQLSVDRIAMLENQCRIWPDPLAAVIYVPLFRNGSNTIHPIIPTYRNTTLEDVVRAIDAFFHLMEATASCVMRAELVGQFLDPLEPDEYPINSLRNRALRMTDTELTFMLDVDFVPTPYLGLPEPGYRDVAVYNQMAELTAKKKALVLPAFEVMNRKQDLVLAQNFARNLVILGKDKLRDLYFAGKVDAFNGQDAPWGHGPTNASRWIQLSSPVTYLASYEPRYEPFLVMNRLVVPWADERFVGYGGNKIAYINQLNGLGFSFHVHPFAYVVHVPHIRTKAANDFVQQKRLGQSSMDDLRAEIEADVIRGTYAPFTIFCETTASEE